MSIDEFAPDLSTLQSDYQILTELRCSANSRTYLARHLKLNRDVTITVFRVPAGEDPNTLTLFATDARTLTVMRHRNVVPVIEGRWVADGVFAIVRARVRGSTLDQLVTTAGPMAVPRVASTLQQVHSAIEWARDNGIVHRYVAADAIVFQQGSGRVLIELDPSSLGGGGVPDACTDARTIGRLSYEMLSGHREADAPALALSDARPELSTEVVRETRALMDCDRDATSRDARALISLLGGKPESSDAMPRKARQSAPAAVPVGPVGHAIVVADPGFGFNARLITAVAVAAIIAVMGILLLHRRSSSEKRSASSEPATKTSVASGDVALPPTKPDTLVTNPLPMATPAPTPPSRSAPVTMPMAPPPTRPRMVPPTTRRHEPPRGMPPSTLPALTPPVLRDSLPSRDVCDSADVDDQRTCVTNAIEHNDAWLTVVYQRLIAAIRRQGNVEEGDPDPVAVTDLRAAQQRWADARLATCRDVGEGALYARARAQCFADQSAKRIRELEEMLAAIP